MLRCQGCSSQNYARSSRNCDSSMDCMLRCKRCGHLKRANRLIAWLVLRPDESPALAAPQRQAPAYPTLPRQSRQPNSPAMRESERSFHAKPMTPTAHVARST